MLSSDQYNPYKAIMTFYIARNRKRKTRSQAVARIADRTAS